MVDLSAPMLVVKFVFLNIRNEVIDTKSGRIKLTESLEVASGTRFSQVVNQVLCEVQDIRDLKNGYKWLDLKNIMVEGRYFIVSLCFYEHELTELNLVVRDTPFELNIDQMHFSEGRELSEQEEYERWLTKEIGTERAFSWGKVWSGYDSKGGAGTIGIRYENKGNPN